MGILCQHLNILFSQIQPEYLFDRLTRRSWEEYDPGRKQRSDSLSASFVGEEVYQHYSYGVLCHLNPDEIKNMYVDMQSRIEKRMGDCGGKTVFSLLPEYTLNVLEERNGIPYCRREEVLNWRECYLRLGQDMLVASYLAYERVRRGVSVRSFCWPAQIHTDDARLNYILKQGMAENHFHLNGSARIFDISWLCLMNHPDRIREYLGDNRSKKDISAEERNIRFCENLSGGTMLGAIDNQWTWEKRFYVAAWLRVILFQWIQSGQAWLENGSNQIQVNSFCELLQEPGSLYALRSGVEKKIQAIRFLYFSAASFLQGGKRSCLDYAVAADRIEEDRENPYRILSGERALLYTAFRWIFSGKIRKKEKNLDFMNLLYLYLLLKAQFRNEIIQLNGRIGFRNFASYENRKDVLFDTYPAYKLEAYNTSVVTAVREEHVISHELRVTPKEHPYKIFHHVWNLDQNIDLLLRESRADRPLEYLKQERRDAEYFYTFHFVKQVDVLDESEKWSLLIKPRNNGVRERVRTQALSLARAMEKYNYLCARIRGIDACNFEIGCRPETFATEFRFLREFVPTYVSSNTLDKNILVPRLSVTYHAGEDFLDLADGMRAIDEALLFLEMRRDDRIGHAMALGISPESYYGKKMGQLVMPKQVRLDDIIWLLYRSRELGVSINSDLLQKMKDEAYHLFCDIFGDAIHQPIDLNDYYDSWQIRGDDPELYRYGRYSDPGSSVMGDGNFRFGLRSQYEHHRILRHSRRKSLDAYRSKPELSALYRSYHYDHTVRQRGREMTTVGIESSYVSLIREMQTKLQQEINTHGIAIECNPSSNVLIAPIDGYSEHPIFRFAPVGKDEIGGNHMYVSVNTDDQGIFDTSLANEYALLLCALTRQRNEDGQMRYSDDEIYEYIDKLRRNGIMQAFPKAQRLALTEEKRAACSCGYRCVGKSGEF